MKSVDITRLPDGGAKFRANIEKLSSQLAFLDSHPQARNVYSKNCGVYECIYIYIYIYLFIYLFIYIYKFYIYIYISLFFTSRLTINVIILESRCMVRKIRRETVLNDKQKRTEKFLSSFPTDCFFIW